jgi:molybdenum cofactor synthesis domain-containing protein
VVAIGNELLSGKVRDENLTYLAAELRPLGVDLKLALVVGDEPQEIVDAIHYARARAEVVITTGGVGPTHDDVTLAAVAQAFGQELKPVPSLVEAIEAHYGEKTNEALLSMALAPEGVELIQPVPFFLPIFRVEQVYVFPGDPEALKLLFNGWKQALTGAPYELARLRFDLDEGELAPHLQAICEAHPGVSVGSYPRFDPGRPYKVLVTIECKDTDQVRAASADLVQRITRDFGAERLLGLIGPEEHATSPRR